MRTEDRIRKAVRIVLLTILCTAVIFPVFYIFSSSLFSQKDFNSLRVLPTSPIWENWRKALTEKHFAVYLMNSVVTSIETAVLRVLTALFASYAFTHLRFRGKRLMLSLLVLTLFIPSDAVLYQNYRTVSSMHLLDTHLGIIIPSLFSASQMLLLSGYFSAMGRESYEAAKIDGAGDLRYIFSILVPLSESVVLTVFIQSLITSFNSYLWPLLVTNRTDTRTIQVGLTMLGFAESGDRGALSATIAVITLPFLLVLALTKSRIEETLIRK